ncbi:MAG: type II toxin-antitoxin system HicA family toxin [Candidatus Taylorbacteria bacterium]|nr:type II toxin-antitoxin system HicA family toxin [Candidatus Taylorbacteria bacterium]
MAKLPAWPHGKVIRALEKLGYEIVRQKGSHIRMYHPYKTPVTIPTHNPVAKGTLRKILRDAEISAQSLIDLAKM